MAENSFFGMQAAVDIARSALLSRGIHNVADSCLSLDESESWCFMLRGEVMAARDLSLGWFRLGQKDIHLIIPRGETHCRLWVKVCGWKSGWPHGETTYGYSQVIAPSCDIFDRMGDLLDEMKKIQKQGQYGGDVFSTDLHQLLQDNIILPKRIRGNIHGDIVRSEWVYDANQN